MKYWPILAFLGPIKVKSLYNFLAVWHLLQSICVFFCNFYTFYAYDNHVIFIVRICHEFCNSFTKIELLLKFGPGVYWLTILYLTLSCYRSRGATSMTLENIWQTLDGKSLKLLTLFLFPVRKEGFPGEKVPTLFQKLRTVAPGKRSYIVTIIKH